MEPDMEPDMKSGTEPDMKTGTEPDMKSGTEPDMKADTIPDTEPEIKGNGTMMGAFMKKVGVIMGSDSDLPVVGKAVDILKEFSVPYEVHVFSAHRTPKEAEEFFSTARERGFGALIAAAGMAAHLAGAAAARTTLPVIGIPVKSAALEGMDALLSTVMMPSGIPVATVAIDGARNAAYLAIEILAVSDEELAKKLEEARERDRKKVLAADKAVAEKL